MRKLLASLVSGLFGRKVPGGISQTLEKTFTNDMGMEFVLIPAGSFMMGANLNLEKTAMDDETPQHKVTIRQPFYLGVYEVTQEQWVSVMDGNNPSRFKGGSNPVENVSWNDVQTFIEKLNANESRGKYRLPTEAEWEYAARAGKSGVYFFGDDVEPYGPAREFGQYVWYHENSGSETHPVGQKQPNPWGLYDIYGNVAEWVEDWYGDNYYANSPRTDPKGPSSGYGRVHRGGSYCNGGARFYRSAYRSSTAPDHRHDHLGFRLAFSPNDGSQTSQPASESRKQPSAVVAPKAELSKAAAPKTMTNSRGMEFVLIPAGSFMMGANPNLEKAYDDDTPQHKVTISRPFYLGVYKVTQEQWEAVMGSNPSRFEGRSNPVERVSWDDVQVFIEKLNTNESRGKYRLPTEAEWEYASRAGKSGAYFFGDDAGELDRYAWYKDNSENKTHPVGQKQPNPWGLYDIYGNIDEWVEDWYGKNYYSGSPATDPTGPSGGSLRVVRGGGLYNTAGNCRSASRDYDTPGARRDCLGFRLAFSPGQ